MKKLNLLSYSFLFIIFFVLIFVIVKQGLITLKIITFNKGDNWQVVEATSNKIYDKIMSLEVGIENRINNYFPLYNDINDLYYSLIMNTDSIYLNNIYLKNNRDDEKIFYNKDNQFYFIVNNLSENELDKRLRNQINYYNFIANKYDLNIAIYMPLRYELNNILNIKNLNNKVNYFIDNLDNKICVGKLESNNNKEYLDYFYKSDHHYNAKGALKAYEDIIKLYNKEDNYTYSTKVIFDEYYGSAAKSLLTDNIKDELSAIDYKNYLVVNINDKLFKPLEITKKDNKYYDYYVSYFNGQYDEVIYHNNINSEENLLIISDSLSWQIDYLLANNFKNTYVVNLRYGKFKKEDLDLEKYINDNNITHLLYLQEAEEEMFDIYNFKINERVR